MVVAKNIFLKFSIVLFLISLFSCFPENTKKVTVDFNGPSSDSSMISFHKDNAIHVAIASMSSPKENFIYYNELLQHISSLINIPVHYIQKESYEEVNQLLNEGAVDFAFICSGAYIDAKKNNSIKLLTAPIINNKTFYKAYIITQKDADINEFSDLKGKSFAYTDPLSNTGYIFPQYRLMEEGINEETFFDKTVFTYGHDLSIQMVNRGIIDAASVHGLIYDFLEKNNKKKIENIKIIESSDWFGIPPIVVPASLDPKRFRLYQNIFLKLHEDPVGKQILDRLNIQKYTIVDDEIYDSIREIKESIKDENI